ncbi:MAG: YncE family protein [Alphaproteobacteria bacterium]|jgi:DNA-binding beta-propeller fold protein YncE|nr:YncE family protein [Alphaproteobacteria bacterium]MDP6515979.1 YncE family protein [Alphaproteobacteria bacterium]
MSHKTLTGPGIGLALAAALALAPAPALADLMIVGGDNKIGFDDTGVKLLAPGNDVVSVIDIGTDPESPRIIANLALMNSLFGPPTNLVITPDERLALVANAMKWVADGDGWKPKPDNRIHVIDLSGDRPRLIDTVVVDRQPSGMAINRKGDLALVAHRAGNSIGVLAIEGRTVRLIQTVEIGEQVAAVAIAPDGRRALVAKFPGHKIAVLDIADGRVSHDPALDMPVGLWPYNIKITPDGTLALSADNGNKGRSDGHVDTVSVIDLTTTPPRVIDRVVVGDAPEGLAISPTGRIAVAILLRGSAAVPPESWFYNRNGSVVVLEIDGKSVRRIGEIEVGGLPEGVVFSPDGSHIYIGNFVDSNISILKVDGTEVTNTGRTLALPAPPGSMRGTTP